MTTSDNGSRRRAVEWPQVVGLGVVAVFLLGVGVLALACLGRLPW